MRSRISPKVEIRKSGINKTGMFAKEHIYKDEIVYVKGGHILTRDELFSSAVINSYLPISDDYYMCIGHRPNLANVPVALAGKVTVQVTGVVEPGDMLVTSGINGTLRSLAQGEDAPYGAILGQALTCAHDGKVLMMVFRR